MGLSLLSLINDVLRGELLCQIDINDKHKLNLLESTSNLVEIIPYGRYNLSKLVQAHCYVVDQVYLAY